MKKMFLSLALLLFPLFYCESQMNSRQFIDLNKEGDTSKNGYNPVANYLDPCDMNAIGNQFNFDYGWNCKRLNQVSVMLPERVFCSDSGLSLQALFDPLHPVDCRMRGFSTPYSGGMIHQELGTSQAPDPNMWLYGLFEAEVAVPTTRGIFPSFWLFGHSGGAAGHNEIDVMEYGVGDVTVHTSHEIVNNSNKYKQKWTYSLPGQTFSNRVVRYAVRWDQNKIVWYVNNNPVRITTNMPGGQKIQSSPMGIIANNQFERGFVKYTDYLPKSDSASMVINYIRVYQRNNNDGVVDFTINGEKGHSINNPILIQNQLPVVKLNFDLSKSYLPEHNFYFIFKAYDQCDLNNEVIYFEKWILPEIKPNDCRNNKQVFDKIYEFKLNELITNDYFPLDVNTCYSATIGCIANNCQPSCPYRCNYNEYGHFETNYFKILPCTTKVNFLINGVATTCQDTGHSVTCLTPILIGDNHGKSRIIMDIDSTQSCTDRYFISIEKSDIQGGRTYYEMSRWLTPEEVKLLPYVDIENLWKDSSNPYPYLEPGCYYRVKLATGMNNDWYEKIQLIRIDSCVVDAEFSLNRNFNDSIVLNIDMGRELVMDASSSLFCSNKYFRVRVESLNNPANQVERTFTTVYSWLDTAIVVGNNLQYKYFQGELNLLEELPNLRGILQCDSTFRVSLEILSDSYAVIDIDFKLFNISQCNPVGAFEIFGQDCFNYSSQDSQQYNNGTSLFMWAPNFVSCDYRARIIISNGNQIEDTIISSQDYILDLRESGDFNLSKLIKALFPNPTALINTNYNISLVGVNSCNMADSITTINVSFVNNGDCGAPFNILHNRKKNSEDLKCILIPNPVDNEFEILLSNDLNSKMQVSIHNLSGSIISSGELYGPPFRYYFDGNTSLTAGIYFVHIKYDKFYKVLKFLKL